MQIGEGGLGGFLHDFAQFPRQGELARSGVARGLDEEDVASGGRPGHADGDARLAHSLGHFGEYLGRAEILAEFRWINFDGRDAGFSRP